MTPDRIDSPCITRLDDVAFAPHRRCPLKTMAPTKSVRKTQLERSLETREKIIQAAIQMMWLHGYAGFRVADVAESAGVSRGAQTHHFPSKAALTIAVVDTLFDVAAESSRKRIANIKPEDDVIQGMIEDASEFFLGKDFSMGLDLLASAERDPELRDGVRTAAKRTRFLVEDMWIGLLLSRGLPRDDAEDVLWLTFSAIRGLAVRMLWQFDQDRFDRLKKTTYRAARDLYEEKRRIPTLKKSRNSGEEN